MTAVEFTARFATTVRTLPNAWTFVMDHVDRVGGQPSIHIRPVWFHDDRAYRFEVSVSGMTEEVRPL